MPPKDHSERIRLVPPGEVPEELQLLCQQADAAMIAGEVPGPTLFGNQVRALAHNPDLLQGLTRVYEVFAETQSVERKLVELGLLVVSHVNACRYCVQHHAPLAHESGLNAHQLQSIQDGDWAGRQSLWSETEWLVIQYAEQLTRDPHQITDTFFAELHEHFSDRQIVDLTMRLALCSAWNKFNDALRLDTESAFHHAFAELGLRE